VFGIWPVSLAPALRTALVDEGLRKIDHFTARYECRTVPFTGDPDPFMNLNAPEDFGLAQQILDA
jgi:molybdopterin-guanine dinucleotide biosynthesis protein A